MKKALVVSAKEKITCRMKISKIVTIKLQNVDGVSSDLMALFQAAVKRN